MIETAGLLLRVIISLMNFILEQQQTGRLKEVHTLMENVKGAKTNEERELLAKKIADFWANP
jgi:hypothetical protein